MALRSGYKGIKKLAAGLKWNRPGILAADDTALAKTFFPRSEQAVLGAKNLLDNRGTSEGNITVNEDKTITVNGTFTARTVFYIRTKQTNYVLPKGTYNLFFSDVSNKFNIVVDAYLGDTWVKNISTTKTNSTFLVDYNGYDRLVVFVVIEASELPATFTNVTFKPMITLATDPDPTYAPYAMTNRELTDAAKLRTVTPTIDGTIVKTYKGGLVAYNLLTRVCTFGVRLVVGSYANYVNFMTGLPKAKSIYSFPCVCTNFARNVGMAVLTTSADGGMYFTGLGQAANFADGDELNISGSYIIADDVVS